MSLRPHSFAFQSVPSLLFKFGDFCCYVLETSILFSVLFCCWAHPLSYYFRYCCSVVLKFLSGFCFYIFYLCCHFVFLCLDFLLFSIYFKNVCNCSLEHFMMAFKVLFGNLLPVSSCFWHLLIVFAHFSWDVFGSCYAERFLKLKSGHFGYYIMRFWILFKS